MSTTTTHSHDDHHITPPSALIKNLILLAIFMGLTILAALVDFGHHLPVSSAMGSVINNVVALIIALIKAYLVISVFMGVKWGSKLIKLWALAGFVWVPLLLLIMGDYMSRSWEPIRGWNTPSQIHGRDASEVALPSELHQRPEPEEEGKPTEEPKP